MKKTTVTGRYANQLNRFLAFGTIVYIQSPDEYEEAEKILDADGIDGLFAYLLGWDNDDGFTDHDVWDMYKHDTVPFGNDDELFFMGSRADYCISLNRKMGYVGLTYCMDDETYRAWLEEKW